MVRMDGSSTTRRRAARRATRRDAPAGCAAAAREVAPAPASAPGGLPQPLVGDTRQALPEPVLGPLVVDAVEVRAQPAIQGRMGPPSQVARVDAVGDAQDGSPDDLLPGVVGGLRVQLADGVGAHREAQREGGHVELGGVAVDARPSSRMRSMSSRCRRAWAPRGVRTRSASKRSLPAGDRRVDGEHRPRPDLREGILDGHAGRDQLAGPLHQQERRVALVEVPGRRGDAQRAQRRTPPTPRTSSWWRRISRPRTYRMCVMGRSASSLRGVSVSSSSSGTRPTWTFQTATWTVRAGQLHGHDERVADLVRDALEGQVRRRRGRGRRAPGGRRHRSTGGSSRGGRTGPRRRTAAPCPRRSCSGRPRARPGRRSRCPATRAARTRRRSRRPGRPAPPPWWRSNQWSVPFGDVRVEAQRGGSGTGP